MTNATAQAFARFDLTGKTAVVVGGSRGMGREMCLALAHAGADVMVVSRKLDACKAVVAEITAETERRAVAVACHVGQWDGVSTLADTAFDTFGHVDILVNNAGISPLYDSLETLSEDLYDKIFAVNLKGPFRLASLMGSRMTAQPGGGSIIFVSSVTAVRPSADAVPYAAAKAGVNTATVALAHVFGPTVRVNCIMPGAFLTDISEHWDMAVVGPRISRYALERAAQPDEITGTVLYLASDASSYTTGAVIQVDGGHP